MSYIITTQLYRPLEDALPTQAPYVLLKTGAVTPRDRWSILGWDPWFTWAPVDAADPLRELDAHLVQLRAILPPDCYAAHLPIPLLMGALSYDLGRTIESIPATARDPLPVPQAILYAFRNYLIADEQSRAMWQVVVDPATVGAQCGIWNPRVGKTVPVERQRVTGGAGGACGAGRSPGGSSRDDPANKAPLREQQLAGQTRECSARTPRTPGQDPLTLDRHDFPHGASNFTRAAYCSAIENIRAMIAAGDCYQVNLSQQFTLPTPRPAPDIFRAALHANPAPMMALIDTGVWQLVSTSPERLVQRHGDALLSRPIKGTRPRGADADADAAARAALAASAKDHAELAMIIDLVRNDLGRVAGVGSVAVAEPWAIETYANVHHLVASVTARARPATSWGALLRAVFPGGSVTGCPKVQAMRVIEQLEAVRRGFYCGSIGYIDVYGNGDWNIAIRTVTFHNGTAVLNVGGGIVYDSDPVAEYEETLHKGATLFAALGEATAE